jgi:two-component system phosphate regulon sensor histidine kinase PhoR
MSPILLTQWFIQVERSNMPLAQAAGVRLQFHAPALEHAEPGPLLWAVVGHNSELISALSNLISNAIRYTPAGGLVTVACERVEQQLHVSVSDTGCGIAAQHIPRLTERFYRVSASRNRQASSAGESQDATGTGLGLAIVKHIMLRHAGELRIQSTPGQGSCFTLVLPMFRDASLNEARYLAT